MTDRITLHNVVSISKSENRDYVNVMIEYEEKEIDGIRGSGFKSIQVDSEVPIKIIRTHQEFMIVELGWDNSL